MTVQKFKTWAIASIDLSAVIFLVVMAMGAVLRIVSSESPVLGLDVLAGLLLTWAAGVVFKQYVMRGAP